jgi:hypothetical protein
MANAGNGWQRLAGLTWLSFLQDGRENGEDHFLGGPNDPQYPVIPKLSLGSYLANIARCATRRLLSGEIPQMANAGSVEHAIWIHREDPFATGAWNGSQGVLEHNSPELAQSKSAIPREEKQIALRAATHTQHLWVYRECIEIG